MSFQKSAVPHYYVPTFYKIGFFNTPYQLLVITKKWKYQYVRRKLLISPKRLNIFQCLVLILKIIFHRNCLTHDEKS